MKKAYFHFSPELNVFLKPSMRGVAFEYSFNGPQSVKHLIESLEVPHTEVSAVRANDLPVGFDYQVKQDDKVEVLGFSSPMMSPDPVSTPTEPGNSNEPIFILDNHLGKLASHLRMLGFDCLYSNNYQDEELAQISQAEGRILLTRDHRLLMRKSILQGYWLRSQDPRQQLSEILKRYDLFHLVKPFKRCMRCNQLLEPVSKQAILHRLQPLTIKYFNDFRLCPDCNQIYWQGSHYVKMLAVIKGIAQDLPKEP